MIVAVLPVGHFLAAVLSLAVPRIRRGLLVASLVADTVLIAFLAHAVLRTGTVKIVLGGWPRQLGIELGADWVSMAFCGLFLVIAAAVATYLWRAELRPYFFLLIHLLFGSILALLFARDLFNIYVILELLTLTSFLLVGYERAPAALWAALKYVVFSAVGMGLYLFGVAVVYAHTGALNLAVVATRIPAAPPPWAILAAALFVTGVGVKAGIFVFSLWLPDAYANASPAVSALLSGLAVNMGFVVLLRLSAVFPIGASLLVLGAITGIFGVIYTMFARDLNRMLAFSSLSQIGYVLIGAGVGATTGAVVYAVAHGLFKGLLFLAGGETVATSGHRRIADVTTGIIPIPARIGLLVGTLGIIGLPPTAGYIGKGLIHGNVPVQIIIGLISLGTVTAFSRLAPIFRFTHSRTASRGKTLAYAILAVPILFFYPIMVVADPTAAGYGLLSASGIGKALGLIAVGYLLCRVLSRTPVSAPVRIFRIEEGTLIVLAGFFLVFFLTWAHPF